VSDNPNDVKNSIYSRAAALERKIEIQSVDVIRDGDSLITLAKVYPPIVDLGKLKSDKPVNHVFKVQNEGENLIEITGVRIPCDCNTAELSSSTILPGESIEVNMSFDPKLYAGHVVKSVYLQLSNGDEIRLVVSAFVE
jgi:hypothetical protein